MATSPIKTLGHIALIFILLFVSLIIVARLGIRVPVLILPLAMLLLWIAVVLWVYRDAEARGMDGLLWGLLVFVGNIIGLLIYMIVRNDASVRSYSLASTSMAASDLCPSCDKGVQPGFAYCPHCGSKMKKQCQNCKKPVSDEWQLCPFCGEKLTQQASEEGK